MGVSAEVSSRRYYGEHEDCSIKSGLCGHEKLEIPPAKPGKADGGFFKSGLF